jgi:hypothetical protein
MSGAPGKKADEITPEMVEAGVEAIGPFDLIHAYEGAFSERAELVTTIYLAMDRARELPSE